MASKPKHIEIKSDKKNAFVPEAFEVLRTALAPKIGGNVNYGVKIAADYFKANGKSDLSTIGANEVLDALKAIAATHKPQEGEDDERGDVRAMIDDDSVDGWNAGEWRNQGWATDLIEALKVAGYGDQNRAPKAFVAKFFAENVAKLDKQVDGPEGSQCALGEKCTSVPNYRFTPMSQNVLNYDGSIKTHNKEGSPLFGQPIRAGQYMVDREKQEVVGPVCHHDVTALRRLEVEFNDRVGAERKVTGMQKRETANAGLAEIAGNAVRRHRPPVQESGSRKMPDSWTTRRNRSGR